MVLGGKLRKFLSTFSDLIDRVSIHQIKQIFVSQYKDRYIKEMSQIVHDLDLIVEEKNIKLTGQLVRAIVILAQINLHIWYNESKVREGKDQDLSLLKLTHSLNGIRGRTNNYILKLIGETDKYDLKVDCLAAEFSEWLIKPEDTEKLIEDTENMLKDDGNVNTATN